MRRRLLRDRRLAQAFIVAMVVVVAAIGLCLFDGDEDGMAGHAAFDLCISLAIFSVGVMLFALAQVHLLPFAAPPGVRAVTQRRLDPPPKFLPLS